MAETVQGGVYLAADGKTYHDANGAEVDAKTLRAFKTMTGQQQDEKQDDPTVEAVPVVVVKK